MELSSHHGLLGPFLAYGHRLYLNFSSYSLKQLKITPEIHPEKFKQTNLHGNRSYSALYEGVGG